jgi:hypothetical protein
LQAPAAGRGQQIESANLKVSATKGAASSMVNLAAARFEGLEIDRSAELRSAPARPRDIGALIVSVSSEPLKMWHKE